jgi:hypothetical protein
MWKNIFLYAEIARGSTENFVIHINIFYIFASEALQYLFYEVYIG